MAKLEVPCSEKVHNSGQMVRQMKKLAEPWPHWSLVPYTKGCGFNYKSEHIPRMWVRSLVKVLTGDT